IPGSIPWSISSIAWYTLFWISEVPWSAGNFDARRLRFAFWPRPGSRFTETYRSEVAGAMRPRLSGLPRSAYRATAAEPATSTNATGTAMPAMRPARRLALGGSPAPNAGSSKVAEGGTGGPDAGGTEGGVTSLMEWSILRQARVANETCRLEYRR